MGMGMWVIEGSDGWWRRQTLVCLWVVAGVDTVISVHGVDVDGHLFIRGLEGEGHQGHVSTTV